MKYHFSLIPFLLTATLLCPLTGCSNPEEPIPSLPADSSVVSQPILQPEAHPFALAFYPSYSIHPSLAENRANLSLAPLLYEGLFQLNDQFDAVPVLCQHYEQSENGLIWMFSLRPGVVFSDGTPLTGFIAAQSLNTARTVGSRYAGRFSNVRSITGDETTVTITLTTPNNALPTLLDIPITLDSSSRPLGTGPYHLQESNLDCRLQLNHRWWQDTPLPFQDIQLFTIQQADDLIAAFDSGDITLLDADLTGTNALGYSGSYEVWNYNTTDFIYLGFNTVKGYCKDSTVRQAISRSIDRSSITAIPYARHAIASSLPFHPDSPLYNTTLANQMDYTPEALVELLSTTSLPKQPLQLLVNSENNAKVATAQYIAYQLETAGLPVTVEKLPWESFLSSLASGKFDLYLGEVLLTADFDISPLLSSKGTLNYSRWSDQMTNELLNTLRSVSPEQRVQEAANLSLYLSEQVPIAPICFKHGCLLTQWGRLSGLSPVPGNIFSGLDSWTLDS